MVPSQRIRCLLIGSVLMICASCDRPAPALPQDSQTVVEIQISLPQVDSGDEKVVVINTKEKLATTLEWLAKGEYDPHPMKWIVIGDISIRDKSGETLHFGLYETSEGGLVFSDEDRNYFMLDTDKKPW